MDGTALVAVLYNLHPIIELRTFQMQQLQIYPPQLRRMEGLVIPGYSGVLLGIEPSNSGMQSQSSITTICPIMSNH
jgi:hypothetical protein